MRNYDAESNVSIVITNNENQEVSEKQKFKVGDILESQKRAKRSKRSRSNGANLGFEEKLWQAT